MGFNSAFKELTNYRLASNIRRLTGLYIFKIFNIFETLTWNNKTR